MKRVKGTWSRQKARGKNISTTAWNLYRVYCHKIICIGSHLLPQQLRPSVEPYGKPWVLGAQCFLPNLNGAKVEGDSLGVFALEAGVDGAAESCHLDDCISLGTGWPTPSAVGISTLLVSCVNRPAVERFQIERAHPTEIGMDKVGVHRPLEYVWGFAALTISLESAVSIRWQPALP